MKNPFLFFKDVSLLVPEKKTALLHEVSLEVFEGEFVILLGHNGSGKSSFLKAINGLFPLTQGSIMFQGKDLSTLKIHERSRDIFTLTQDPNLSTFSGLTVFENCLMAGSKQDSVFGVSSRKRKEKVREHLKIYSPSLADKIDVCVSSLSGGERQMLALSMILKRNPFLLLLDEHTSALDPLAAKKVMELTDQLIKKEGITTIATTHNLDDALRYGSRIVALREGRVILDVSNEEKRKMSRDDLLSLYQSNVLV